MDIYGCFSYFHVVNAKNLTTNWSSQKPEVLEVGPYCYSEYYEKKNVVELNSEHLSYDSSVQFTWDQTETDRRSCRPVPSLNGNTACHQEDKVVILNPVLVSLSQMIPRSLVLDQDQLSFLDANKTNSVIKETLDKFWEDMDDALSHGGCDSSSSQINNCQDELFIEISVRDIMFDGELT